MDIRASLELRVGAEGKEQSMGKQSDTFAMPPKSRRGGVQSEFVRVRDIAHNVLCLASPTSPTSPTQREYRAILEVSATNYTLRSEEEQDP